MDLSQEIVKAELAVINNFYRPPKSIDQIELLSSVYFDDCKHLSASDFMQAIAMHRKSSRFFPTPIEIIEWGQQVQAERRRNTKQLEEPELTEEQRALNLKYIKKFKQRMKIKTVPKIRNANQKGERFPNLKTKHAQTVRDQAKEILDGTG